MGKQHVVRVEALVMESLLKHLRPSVRLDNVLDYVNHDIDPSMYSSEREFTRDYVYVSFLRKWKGFKHKDINPEWAAFSTWLNAEKQCFQTNRRLEYEASTSCYSIAPRIISDAQRKIARILGRLDAERVAELCRFGGGATYDLKKGSTHAEKSSRPSITFDAIPWICRSLSGDDYLGSLVGPFDNLKVVQANRMVMVPKSVKTDRPIAAEPTLNSYIQQGFGRYLRHRLKRFGVDLGDQTINQDLARIAKDWGLTTLDLSSASDTLCANLVKLLLPNDWWEALDSVRCKSTEFKGRRFHLSKFSSMGNAFTFELESMIFFALISSASVGGVSSVYGDDLVVLDCDYRPTLEVLAWAGFTINERKSFTAGSRFYESCGRHYFDNQEVTPCYQKDVCKRPHDYVRLHNRLVRAGIRLNLRMEIGEAAQLVRERCRTVFGKSCPGVGPLVEYDEYFIKEDYVWASETDDSFKIMSAVTVPRTFRYEDGDEHVAYFGRKLRSPGFLNPDPKGQCSDSSRPKLLCLVKKHWRSKTLRSSQVSADHDSYEE